MTHRSRLVARVLGVAMLLAASVVPGRAQTEGGISGLVTDSSGAAVPGATVTVTNTATRGTRNTTTNAAGLYTFPAGASRHLCTESRAARLQDRRGPVLQGRRPADGASGRAVAGRCARRDGDRHR